VDTDTPASPDPAPSKAHGDAFLDQSGSRQGTPPERSGTPPEGDQDADGAQ
jgi:hypothetical protein